MALEGSTLQQAINNYSFGTFFITYNVSGSQSKSRLINNPNLIRILTVVIRIHQGLFVIRICHLFYNFEKEILSVFLLAIRL